MSHEIKGKCLLILVCSQVIRGSLPSLLGLHRVSLTVELIARSGCLFQPIKFLSKAFLKVIKYRHWNWEKHFFLPWIVSITVTPLKNDRGQLISEWAGGRRYCQISIETSGLLLPVFSTLKTSQQWRMKPSLRVCLCHWPCPHEFLLSGASRMCLFCLHFGVSWIKPPSVELTQGGAQTPKDFIIISE